MYERMFAWRSRVEGDELLREVGHHPGASLLHGHQILDPDAELAGQVDARLHGDHVAGAKLALRGLGDARALVHLESHAVTKPVPEVRPVSCRLDRPSGDTVQLGAADAGPHLGQGLHLRGANELVDLERLTVEVA